MYGATSDLRDSVRSLIDRQAVAIPDRVFLVDPGLEYELNFDQLQQQCRAIAGFLNSQGIKPGSSVAFAMHNGYSCAAVVLGIMYGGYRAVAINLVAGPDTIAYVLEHSQTAFVFTQNEYVSNIEEALTSNRLTGDDDQKVCAQTSLPPIVCVSKDVIEQWLGMYSCHFSECPLIDSDDALLMYTSGTTGKPKGVTLSHANVIAGGRNVVIGHVLADTDRALCVLPVYHINGLCVTLLAPLVAGSSLVIPQKFSTSAFWKLIDEYLCTWFSVVPTQIAYLLRDADSNDIQPQLRQHLRFGRSASAPLSPDVHGAFEKRFCVPLIETMGLTETAAQILTNPLPPAQRKPGSAGIAVGDEVIIVDRQLNVLAPGQEGELLVRGANVMGRYFRNTVATQEALVDGGWLRTGDLGSIDNEGYVFITGRLKELIIKGGENIAPREIDDALYQHTDVVEAAAFARQCKNYGQRVEAAVVLKSASSLSETDLLDTCKLRVGAFKCPDKIHFLAELPKGPSGKIQRAKILEALSACK